MGLKEIVILMVLFLVLMAFMAGLLYFLFNYDNIEKNILEKRELEENAAAEKVEQEQEKES